MFENALISHVIRSCCPHSTGPGGNRHRWGSGWWAAVQIPKRAFLFLSTPIRRARLLAEKVTRNPNDACDD